VPVNLKLFFILSFILVNAYAEKNSACRTIFLVRGRRGNTTMSNSISYCSQNKNLISLEVKLQNFPKKTISILTTDFIEIKKQLNSIKRSIIKNPQVCKKDKALFNYEGLFLSICFEEKQWNYIKQLEEMSTYLLNEK
jgi:hypothetical protein